MKVNIYYKSKSSGQKKDPYQAGGLASNALHSVAVLGDMGVEAALHQVDSYKELVSHVGTVCATSGGLTHVVVEALWVTPAQAQELAETFSSIVFVFRPHSKMGFLQVEPQAILTMKGIIELSRRRPNVFLASNNEEFCRSINEAFGLCIYLPNLYDLASAPTPMPRGERDPQQVLRIASFGASRLLKLHPSAALAAIQIARLMEMSLDFYVNSDSTPGGASVRKTVANLFEDVPGCQLVEVGWQDTQQFKRTISYMDLVLQTSATETFCMVAADAVASGVPVVVGPAISWVRERWQAPIDDTSEVARVGVKALDSCLVRWQQKRDLTRYVKQAKNAWANFLGLPCSYLLW